MRLLIADVRNKQGVSLRWLEIRTGISRSKISRWEKGKSDPKMGELEKIAKALHVKMAELYEEDEDE